MQSVVGLSRVASVPRAPGAGRPVVAPAGPAPFTTPRDVSACVRKKGIRLIVTVECTESRAAGATPSRYVTQKNRKNTPDRLELMKYNPNLKRHTLHKEIK